MRRLQTAVVALGFVAATLPARAHAESGENGASVPPLLGSSHGRSLLVEFCKGKPAGAKLPPDPRRLVRPGVNAGGAVMFNAWWEDCHVDVSQKQPTTSGELRSRAERGRDYLALHHMPHDIFKISAEQYDNLWQVWGFRTKPENYEAEVRERYGLGVAPYRNPYPLAGEDPNQTAGGSGRLPLGLVQVSKPGGGYTGEVTINCLTCHSGSVGDPAIDRGPGSVIGLGGANLDAQLLIDEMALGLPVPISLSSTRGTTNAEGLSELLFGFRDLHSMDPTIHPLRSGALHANGGDTKMPSWWNLSHRPRKFHEAGLSSDNGRMAVLLWYASDPFTYPGSEIRKTDPAADDVQAYFDTLEAPAYPGPINESVARVGASLFHTRDLWANGDNPVARPTAGNGSCAGCHGVYSPFFATNTRYLADPQLRGMAAYVSPIGEIGTDPARLNGMPMSLRKGLGVSWISYPEGQPGYVAPETKDWMTEQMDDYQFFGSDEGLPNDGPGQPFGVCPWEQNAIGYQAPVLHGVWATAPYFHNGSVPDVWGVLDPESRPAIWVRPSSTGPTINHGFDTSLSAYDGKRLGWKYTVLACETAPSVPYVACDPGTAPLDPAAEAVLRAPGNSVTAGYVATPGNPAFVEFRKIYNTHMFGKGNHGHEWTAVLSDPERRALIEYLKTL